MSRCFEPIPGRTSIAAENNRRHNPPVAAISLMLILSEGRLP